MTDRPPCVGLRARGARLGQTSDSSDKQPGVHISQPYGILHQVVSADGPIALLPQPNQEVALWTQLE